MPDIYEKYATIKMKIKSLESELEELKPELEQTLFEEDGEKVENKWGSFKFMSYPKWLYSDDLTMKEKMIKHKIKLLKKEEEKNGKAEKLSDGMRVVYTQPKI